MNAAPPATRSLENERFGFTLFMSLCAHAVFILGVGFTYLEREQNALSLEITLARYESAEAPAQADFLAQVNQEGSGTLEERAAPSTPVDSRFNADMIQETRPFEEAAAATPSPRPLLSAEDSSSAVAASEDENREPPEEARDTVNREDYEQTLASLQAQLDLHRQAYANRPRRHTISSASAREARDARYLDSWRRKIEAVGNLNYPQQASAEGIYGQLRMLVALRQDGSVAEIRILSSSGHSILDEAAVRIVRLAAPFEPFPEEMRRDVDILEIIRTWQFHNSNSLRSF